LILLCAGCHGMSGEGRADAGYPRLAGQPQAYLVRQLEAYADGRRRSAVMEPLARSLTAEERQRLAAEFSGRTAPVVEKKQSYSVRGEVLAVRGDHTLRVQACQNCHGPLGRGQPPYGPALAGLSPQYLRAEMAAWRSGARRTDPSGQMPAIAQRLPERDVAEVASYYAGLPVPRPAGTEIRRYARQQPPTREDVGEAGSGSR
jgi:cytochrome c553